MNDIRTTVHNTAKSRVTDGGRFYWKNTTVFMWHRKKGKRDITTHSFYLPYWIDAREALKDAE